MFCVFLLPSRTTYLAYNKYSQDLTALQGIWKSEGSCCLYKDHEPTNSKALHCILRLYNQDQSCICLDKLDSLRPYHDKSHNLYFLHRDHLSGTLVAYNHNLEMIDWTWSMISCVVLSFYKGKAYYGLDSTISIPISLTNKSNSIWSDNAHSSWKYRMHKVMPCQRILLNANAVHPKSSLHTFLQFSNV